MNQVFEIGIFYTRTSCRESIPFVNTNYLTFLKVPWSKTAYLKVLDFMKKEVLVLLDESAYDIQISDE